MGLTNGACQALARRRKLGHEPPNATMSDLIPADELEVILKKCPEWELEFKDDRQCIVRTIEFEEFMEAIDFVNDLAEIAEEAQHHPDIEIRFNKVTLQLTSHDVGGITELDVQLAQRIDNVVS